MLPYENLVALFLFKRYMKTLTKQYKELNESEIKRTKDGIPYIEVSKNGSVVFEPDWDHLLSLTPDHQKKYSQTIADMNSKNVKTPNVKTSIYDLTFEDFKNSQSKKQNDVVLYKNFIESFNKNSKLYTKVSDKAKKSYDEISKRI